jgi:hypothetical protein
MAPAFPDSGEAIRELHRRDGQEQLGSIGDKKESQADIARNNKIA